MTAALPRHFLSRYSRSAALIRDCQPGPVARKCSMTSGSRRSETSFFAASDLGRPRPLAGRITVSPIANSALSNHSPVSSGMSSYSSGWITWASSLAKSVLITRLFPVIGLSHRNDAPSVLGGRPDHNHHSPGKQANRDVARLRIGQPFIWKRELRPGKDMLGIQKIDAAPAKRLRSLRRIEADLHPEII